MITAAPSRERHDVLTADRPAWRGLMHAWAFFAVIPAGVLLIIFAEHAAAKTAASIYFAALLAVFGTSAAYHRLTRTYRQRLIMQRLDHAMIYLMIAGSYAPICLVALPRAWGIPLMAVVGGIGVLGMALKAFAWNRGKVISYVLYLVMGWAAMVALPVMATHLSGLQLTLVITSGVAYTVGVPVLLLRRPDPWPKVFGYHEIWHTLTVVAAFLHFGAVALVLR